MCVEKVRKGGGLVGIGMLVWGLVWIIVFLVHWLPPQELRQKDLNKKGCKLRLDSSPDLPASFSMRSEAEGLVSQVT